MVQNYKTVLIVEDSVLQAASLGLFLKKNGLQVLHAPNGRIGVFMAKRYVPDAIVLDVEMPQMNGFETCRHIKEDPQTADIPVLMLSVHDDPATLTKGMDLGAVGFIPKDAFAFTVLREALRQLHVLNDDRVKVA